MSGLNALMGCLARFQKFLRRERKRIGQSMKPNRLLMEVLSLSRRTLNDTVLIFRCKDRITDAAFSTRYNYLGSRSVDVTLRMNNDEKPFKGVWKASIDEPRRIRLRPGRIYSYAAPPRDPPFGPSKQAGQRKLNGCRPTCQSCTRKFIQASESPVLI